MKLVLEIYEGNNIFSFIFHRFSNFFIDFHEYVFFLLFFL